VYHTEKETAFLTVTRVSWIPKGVMPKWEPVIGECAKAWEGIVVKGVGALVEEGNEVLGTTVDGVLKEVLLASGLKGLVVAEEEVLAATPEEFVGSLEGEDIRGRRRKRKRLSRWSASANLEHSTLAYK
jgi:hypothetical protein